MNHESNVSCENILLLLSDYTGAIVQTQKFDYENLR